MTKARGFILQASYRVVSGTGGQRRPVVHIHGRLEGGGTFMVRAELQRPHFYFCAVDAEVPRALRLPDPKPTDKLSFAGAAVCRLEAEIPQDVPGLRDRLHAAGIGTFEADVRFAMRYLIDRGIKGGCEIDGAWVPGNGVTRLYSNPALSPAPTLGPSEVDVEPRVLSFDMETEGKGDDLLAISLYAPGIDEVLIVDGTDRAMPERATRCADERAALDAFCARVKEFDPDVLIGWNVIDFDLTALPRIAARVNHPLSLGREAGAVWPRQSGG